MRIRFLREWRCYQSGAVVELAGGVADTLIRRHYAEAAPEVYGVGNQPFAENASVVPPESAVKRKRGRPRKIRV